MFASLFAAIYHLSGDQFFVPGEVANTQTFQYFSFTTLTTLGYGDYTAYYSSGQAVAVLEALTGADIPGHAGGPAGLGVPWAAGPERLSYPGGPTAAGPGLTAGSR